MFGLGGVEVLVILLVGVVVLGPERLPKVMRSFTKVMSEFRRISTDLQRTINSEVHLEEYNRKQQLGIDKPVKKKKKKKAAPDPVQEPTGGESTAPEQTEPVDAQTAEPESAQPGASPEATPTETPENGDGKV